MTDQNRQWLSRILASRKVSTGPMKSPRREFLFSVPNTQYCSAIYKHFCILSLLENKGDCLIHVLHTYIYIFIYFAGAM